MRRFCKVRMNISICQPEQYCTLGLGLFIILTKKMVFCPKNQSGYELYQLYFFIECSSTPTWKQSSCLFIALGVPVSYTVYCLAEDSASVNVSSYYKEKELWYWDVLADVLWGRPHFFPEWLLQSCALICCGFDPSEKSQKLAAKKRPRYNSWPLWKSSPHNWVHLIPGPIEMSHVLVVSKQTKMPFLPEQMGGGALAVFRCAVSGGTAVFCEGQRNWGWFGFSCSNKVYLNILDHSAVTPPMLFISEFPLSFTGAVFCPIISLRSSSVCAEHAQEVTEVSQWRSDLREVHRGAWGSAPSSALAAILMG